MISLLLDNKTAREVAERLYELMERLDKKGAAFSQIFPVILTDNGGEFARVEEIERDHNGASKLFFCDPGRADQKGEIEKNHTLLRDILPKGTSFDALTQEDLNLIFSHLTSSELPLTENQLTNSSHSHSGRKYLHSSEYSQYPRKKSANHLN